jgi:hypothetical protein
MSGPQRSLSTLAAAILLPTILGSGEQAPASSEPVEPADVRRNTGAARLTDGTSSNHPHGPSGHGA